MKKNKTADLYFGRLLKGSKTKHEESPTNKYFIPN